MNAHAPEPCAGSGGMPTDLTDSCYCSTFSYSSPVDRLRGDRRSLRGLATGERLPMAAGCCTPPPSIPPRPSISSSIRALPVEDARSLAPTDITAPERGRAPQNGPSPKSCCCTVPLPCARPPRGGTPAIPPASPTALVVSSCARWAARRSCLRCALSAAVHPPASSPADGTGWGSGTEE